MPRGLLAMFGSARLSSLPALAALFLLLVTGIAHAQLMDDGKPLGAAAQGEKPAYLKDAGVVERLNQRLPLAAQFTDEEGHSVQLGNYFTTGRPVELALVYFHCAMLCPQVLHGMAQSLKQTGLTPGKDYSIVVTSIDPMDTPADAAAAKRDFLNEMGQPDAGDAVHFLTGQPPAIAQLASATGFHYVRVPGPDGKLDQFAHASVVMFATPTGVLSQYLSGIDYPARDVRLALVSASGDKIATPKDLFLIYCCNYVPTSGRYTVAIVHILGIAGMLTVAGMIALLYLLTRKKRQPAAA